MSVLYHEPRRPEQVRRERLATIIVFAVLGVLVTIIFLNDKGEPAMGQSPRQERCVVEDEVLVVVEEDAFDLHQGDTRCVHIDSIQPTKEPEQ